uniref:Uncharacterized protein n=1 Tax=Arundo donax TaxID=35708 RepID=A0A0A9FDA0_ARUDO
MWVWICQEKVVGLQCQKKCWHDKYY